MSFLKSYYNSVSSFLAGDEVEEKNESDTMKEKADEECQVKESKSEGWLSGLYNDAYNNSGEVWRAVKTDLSEFATVISKDAKTVVIKTANGVKHGLVGDEAEDDNTRGSDNSSSTTSKIKAGINRMLEQVSKTLYIPPDSDDDDFYYNNDTGSQTICSRIDARIAHLQSDKHTFASDPIDSELDTDLGDFNLWKEKLNMDDFQSTIAELVKNNSCLLDNFTELVPDRVTFDEFWARYFYRVASVKAEESRRELLKLRISEEENVVDSTDPGDWDEGNDMNEEICTMSCATVVQETLVSNVAEETTVTTIDNADNNLKILEKYDVIVVKHVESSSASEDNNQVELSTETKESDDFQCWDDDDDVDVDVTAEELELAKKVSDKDVLESKWEDWR